MARPLRVATPKDAPAPPMTLAQAVETGDYRSILVAQRREIALSLPDERGPAKAALHRQLSAIAKELDAMDAKTKQEASEDGELAGDEEWSEEAI